MGTTRYNKDGFKYYTYNKGIQGSTTSVVGQDGTSPVAYDYDDFGVTRSIGDSTFFNEICYTGAIYDVSTGLYYLNARYYDPKNGRFITRDTYRGEINELDTQHLYAYCANNPINYVDPSGHRRRFTRRRRFTKIIRLYKPKKITKSRVKTILTKLDYIVGIGLIPFAIATTFVSIQLTGIVAIGWVTICSVKKLFYFYMDLFW